MSHPAQLFEHPGLFGDFEEALPLCQALWSLCSSQGQWGWGFGKERKAPSFSVLFLFFFFVISLVSVPPTLRISVSFLLHLVFALLFQNFPFLSLELCLPAPPTHPHAFCHLKDFADTSIYLTLSREAS